MNIIIKVNRKQLKQIQQKLEGRENLYVAKTNGLNMLYLKSFVQEMQYAFNTVESNEGLYMYNYSFQAWFDFMTYPWWLIDKGYRGFAMIIYNSDLMMLLQPKLKKDVLWGFNYIIDPEEMKTGYEEGVMPYNIYLETPFAFNKKNENFVIDAVSEYRGLF